LSPRRRPRFLFATLNVNETPRPFCHPGCLRSFARERVSDRRSFPLLSSRWRRSGKPRGSGELWLYVSAERNQSYDAASRAPQPLATSPRHMTLIFPTTPTLFVALTSREATIRRNCQSCRARRLVLLPLVPNHGGLAVETIIGEFLPAFPALKREPCLQCKQRARRRKEFT